MHGADPRITDPQLEPLDELASRLRGLAPWPSSFPGAALNGLEPFGGLWGVYAADIWEHTGVPVMNRQPLRSSVLSHTPIGPIPTASPAQQQGERPVGEMQRRQVTSLNTSDFTPVLMQCQSRLAAENLKFILPLLAPFFRSGPRCMARVTERAVVWALLARHLMRNGPGARPLAGATTVDRWPGGALPVRYRVDDSTTPGDVLSLHLQIEKLIDHVDRVLHPASRPDPELRSPGGLRRPLFLRVYISLSASRSGSLRNWRQAIDSLVAISPLTQMVYPDVLEPSTLPSVTGVCVLGPHSEPCNDLWFSHIARSLLAGLLAAPRTREDWVSAETYRRTVELRAQAWARWWNQSFLVRMLRRQPVSAEQYRGLDSARRHADAWLEQRIASTMGRLDRLGRIMQRLDGTSAGRVIHWRFLELLVRHIAEDCMPEMSRIWRNSDGDTYANKLLLGENSVTEQRFRCIVTGTTAEEDGHNDFPVVDPDSRPAMTAGLVLERPVSESYFENLQHLFDPPHLELGGPEAAEVGQRAGLPAQRVREAWSRLSDGVRHGIPLPGRPPNDTGGSCLRTLTGWATRLRNNLQRQQDTREVPQ